ncbi:MAG: hypothetical protein OXH02_07410 [Gemmatimonadetes bacterium]|nr:hypothetical protein [Gemmatimonadota bacterium]
MSFRKKQRKSSRFRVVHRLYTRLNRLDPDWDHVPIFLTVLIAVLVIWLGYGWSEAEKSLTGLVFLGIGAYTASFIMNFIIDLWYGEFNKRLFTVSVTMISVMVIAFFVFDVFPELWLKYILAGFVITVALVVIFKVVWVLVMRP